MGSSYTWCNSCKVTLFLNCRFLKDLTVKKDTIKCYCFPLLSLSLFIVFYLIKGHLPFLATHFLNESLNSLHPTHLIWPLFFFFFFFLDKDNKGTGTNPFKNDNTIILHNFNFKFKSSQCRITKMRKDFIKI